MFENLLFQDRVQARLRTELETGKLPPAILFSGEQYSGKLSAALEIGRALNCQRDSAPWNCRCPGCRSHRLLDSPYLVMAGKRGFSNEIRAALTSLIKKPEQPLFFLLYRNIKKLIRRFDPFLWADEEKKLGKAALLVEKLEDLLESFHPELETPAPPDEAAQEKLLQLCSDLEGLVPADGFTINMIRRLSYWARTSDSSIQRTVILEEAQLMNDSVRNAFLKILEEPPTALHFILISSRSAAILPTIRSRVREYRFAPRGPREVEGILSRIYRHDSESSADFHSLGAFFMDHALGNGELRTRGSDLLLQTLIDGNISSRDELAGLINNDRLLLKNLITHTLSSFRRTSDAKLLRTQRILEDLQYRIERYNISVPSALEIGYI